MSQSAATQKKSTDSSLGWLKGGLVFAFLLPVFLSLGLANFTGVDHNHRVWQEWVDQFSETTAFGVGVNYDCAIRDRQKLDAYLVRIRSVTEAQYKRFSLVEKKAFLANAYNAYTVALILAYYPVKTIKTVGGDDQAWKIPFVKLLGQTITLDQLENEWVRPWFKDQNMHFALVCAAKGCPALRWYSARSFDRQVRENALSFLLDTEKNYFVEKEKKWFISPIFEWYQTDFAKDRSQMPQVLTSYLPVKALQGGEKSGLPIAYTNYDWDLNTCLKRELITEETFHEGAQIGCAKRCLQ